MYLYVSVLYILRYGLETLLNLSIKHPALNIVLSVFISVRFLCLCGLPPRGFLGCRSWYIGYCVCLCASVHAASSADVHAHGRPRKHMHIPAGQQLVTRTPLVS